MKNDPHIARFPDCHQFSSQTPHVGHTEQYHHGMSLVISDCISRCRLYYLYVLYMFTAGPYSQSWECSATRTLRRKMMMRLMLMMMLYLKEFIMSPHRLFSLFRRDDLETILNFGLAKIWPSELSGWIPPPGLAAYLF